MYWLLLRCLLLSVFFSLQALAEDDDDQPVSASNQPLSSKMLSTAETADIQTLGGIKTQKLEPVAHRAEISVHGTVLSLEPLLLLRQNYLLAQSEQAGAQARYREAEQQLDRVKHLHGQDIVATHRLQAQQAQWQVEKAQLGGAGFRQQALLNAARLEWGDRLIDWFSQPNHPEANTLIDHKARLLQIVVRPEQSLPEGAKSIAIDPQGRRDQAIQARLISSSPQIDPVTQGRRYFFKLEGVDWPYGSQITGWLPVASTPVNGVSLPESALVWHLGQALIFVKQADGRFERRVVDNRTMAAGGYFVADTSLIGQEVAVSGAQTLLSQQLKGSIGEDDD